MFLLQFESYNRLTYLDLQDCLITQLSFDRLPTPDGHLEVDLRGNPISINSSEADYKLIVEKFRQSNNITIRTDKTFDCDCQLGWISRALRALPNVNVSIKCKGITTKWHNESAKMLLDIPQQYTECDKTQCSLCTCRRDWRSGHINATCEGTQLQSLPHWPSIQAVYARGSQIKTLHVEDFPDTLQYMDLSNNRIASTTEDVAAAMFARPDRYVRLDGNPILCQCDNLPLVAALHRYHTQVLDFKNITCTATETALADVVLEDLCKHAYERLVLIAVACSGTIITLLAVAGILYYSYRQELKVFLYARGWCLCWVREEELDADRQYDAFISFSHHDEDFLSKHILPELEADYKLCLHTRNWIPGEFISTQITRSVEQSRRTVILLSRNFVTSLWGMLEFRTAYLCALHEGRVRVIIIVLDDVIADNNIDAELRNYLRTNTYVKYADPRFWEKLKYALPHRKTFARSKHSDLELRLQ